MKRTSLTRKTRLRARHRTKGGRNSLPDKLAWLRTQACDICGARPVEVHHDRFLGSRATDERTIPLCVRHHREGPEAVQTLGRTGFQEFHDYTISARCALWHERWEREQGAG